MSNYWATRFIEEEQRIYELTEKEIERQLLEYEKAISSINKEIEIWYNRIAKNNEVSFIEAKQLLNKKELKELKWTLEEYIEYAKKNGLGNKWTKELNNASSRIHIERLEALKLQTNAQIEKFYNIRDKRTENHLKNIYTEHYKKSSEAILKTGLVGGKKTKFDEKLVDKVIKKPWAPDGKHFSDRLWNDKEKLLNVLHTELTQGFIRGDKLDTLINRISKKLNASKSNVARLVHTESSAYSSRARYESFKDVGVEKYEIVAALDNRTSDICRSMDSKVFDIKEYEIGITAPPFHVRCRTTTAPVLEDLEEIRDNIISKTSFNEEIYDVLEKEFGELSSKEVILRKERLGHIRDRHPEIEKTLLDNHKNVIHNPDYILKDKKYNDTIWIIKKMKKENINLIIKLSMGSIKYKNSIITSYILNNKRLEKHIKKLNIIYDLKK